MDDKPVSSEPERPGVLHDEQAQRQKQEKAIEQDDPPPPEKTRRAPEERAPDR